MALATRCPSCHALFRVVADQLKLRGGLVRCGACGHAFDAIGTLSYVDDASVTPAAAPAAGTVQRQDAALTLRIAPADARTDRVVGTTQEPARVEWPEWPELPPAKHADKAPASPQMPDSEAAVEDDAAQIAPEQGGTEDERLQVDAELPALSDIASDTGPAAAPVEAGPETQNDDQVDESLTATAADVDGVASEGAQAEEPEAPQFLQQNDRRPTRLSSALLGMGLLLLAATFLVQAALLYRSELIANWPAAKPAFTGLCRLLACTVGWPTRGDMLAVVGSELQAMPGTSLLELTAVVRNRAEVTLALPAIEVTLTDTQSRTVARKIFAPVDYLAADSRAKRIDEGLDAGADLTIKLTFEARDVNPAGFVVYPFYR